MSALKKTILIIDDEVELVGILSEYFESLGYTVYKAYDAKSGMAELDKNTEISLVISDIGMPGMSGLEFLKIIRETREEIPIIMITGLKSIDHVISAIRNGAKDYIIKPFSLEDVRKVVEKVLKYRIKNEKKTKILEYADSLHINYTFVTKDADAGVIAYHLAKILHDAGFCNRDQFNQYQVAFLETIINSIEHGNLELPSTLKGDDFEKMIQFEELREARFKDPNYCKRLLKIELSYDKDRFAVKFIDEGPGFDWKSYVVPGNLNGKVNTKSYGRGLQLISHIIDEIQFNDKGNEITLIKHRSSVEPTHKLNQADNTVSKG
jgi:CheY-like chemotaxis protein